MGVTIKDIAKAARVSATTVSNVINGKTSKTTEETKQRILSLVKELDYKPNAMARSLVNGETKLIGVILPDISNAYFSQLVRRIEEAAEEHGYSILVCSTHNNAENEHKYINLMREHCVDGMIIGTSSIKETWQFEELLRMKYPIVAIDRNISNFEDVCNVYIDNYNSAYEATRYFIELGHRNIGCINGTPWSTASRDSVEGYRQAMKDYGLKLDEGWIYSLSYDVETGIKGAEKLLNYKNKVTAILACSDTIAYGVYKAASKLNISIPKDLSVIGLADLMFSEVITPSLTTFSHPLKDMAKRAIEELITIISKEPREKTEYVYTAELVIRESVHGI
ncbi:MAG: LacI family DNA-binding transcriptional regulator [Clostridium sp.]